MTKCIYLCFNQYKYFKGESTIVDVPIQAGDPEFGYRVTVQIRIYDIYGDYGSFKENIRVSQICYYHNFTVPFRRYMAEILPIRR